jgi:hypothetical protein
MTFTPAGDLDAAMKKNPTITVGAILVTPQGTVTELTPVRLHTLSEICRKQRAPDLQRDQGDQGRWLLRRLLERADRPFPMEIIIDVLIAAQLCGREIDPSVRAIIAVVEISTDPKDYPVEVFRAPFHCDFSDSDEVSALVASLVRTTGEVGVPPADNQARALFMGRRTRSPVAAAIHRAHLVDNIDIGCGCATLKDASPYPHP